MPIVNNLEDTQKFALQLADNIRAKIQVSGMIIALEGELGAGKTTFVKFLAKALGSEDLVSSPSYVIERTYKAKHNIEIYHWDLYRVQAGDLPEDLDLSVMPNRLILIEWPNVCPEITSYINLSLSFKVLDLERRRIETSYVK